MMVLRILFGHKAKPTIPPTARDIDDDRKMAEARRQNDRANRLFEGAAEAASEFSAIRSRIRRDDPIMIPGIHKTIRGNR